MTKTELEFRQELIRLMSGLWVPTIHVENHLNPGVPDLSYVMIHPEKEFETGWIELKAIDVPRTPEIRFKIEPSQHRWIGLHERRVPVHFLVAAGGACWLIPGRYHNDLARSQTIDSLNNIGIGFQREAARHVLHTQLQNATQRGRL